MSDVIDVAHTLSKHSQGSSRNYDVLVCVLSDEHTQESQIAEIVHQLKYHASNLGKEHRALISAVLHLKWNLMSHRVIADYQALIVNLISSNTLHLRPCLKMIVSKFVPVLATEERVEITEEMKHPHRLLNAIVQLVPLAPTVLLPLLVEMCPSVYRQANIHESYFQHLFHLTTYLPRHRIEILSLIVDHLLKLDVHAPKHEIEDSEDSDEEDELFAMETDSLEQPVADAKMVHAHANKLDILMELLFKYIKSKCFQDGVLDWEVTRTVYRELLHVFDRLILPTHASNHVQFCMFYICSFHDTLHEGFIDYLWQKVVDPNQQAVFRQVAVSYIASLLARAKYVNLSVVIAVFDLMVSWIHCYIHQSADNTVQPNLGHHGPFYSVCQALFYVFIYRNRELMLHERGAERVRNAKLPTIVTCRLNPLRFCLPVITQTFASVARQHQLALCDTVIEKNKRNTLPVEGSSDASGKSNPLDSYFPFDPYILKRSSQYVEDLYQEYSGAPVAEDGGSDEEDTQDVWRESGMANEVSASQSKASLSSSIDFLEYGISPGFKHT